MTVVVSVRFKDSGREYYFDPGDLEIHQGDMVIVETVHGPELGKVIYHRLEVPESDITSELKPVLRLAHPDDLERTRALQENIEDVLCRCNEKIREHHLPMHLVKAEYNFDGSRLTFYFTAEQRVDFRLLVRDLARTFKTRIELRQIGPRDEAKLLGGIGICGRMLCCATFLPNYARVSVKMAKDQDLPLTPSKISGLCGRLLCCLSYEHHQYCELKAGLPRRGARVQTPDGVGDVVFVNVLQQVVTVQLAHSGMQEDYPVQQVRSTTEKVLSPNGDDDDKGIAPFLSFGEDEQSLAFDTYDGLEDDSERTARSNRPHASPKSGGSQRKSSPAHPVAHPPQRPSAGDDERRKPHTPAPQPHHSRRKRDDSGENRKTTKPQRRQTAPSSRSEKDKAGPPSPDAPRRRRRKRFPG